VQGKTILNEEKEKRRSKTERETFSFICIWRFFVLI